MGKMIHPIKRAKERYDLDLCESDIEMLECKIKNDKSIPICRTSRSRSVHAVPYLGHILYAVYRNGRKPSTEACIRTFLTKEMVKNMYDMTFKEINNKVFNHRNFEYNNLISS